MKLIQIIGQKGLGSHFKCNISYDENGEKIDCNLGFDDKYKSINHLKNKYFYAN